jgi:alpha,alpha-trehalose phosphorylase
VNARADRLREVLQDPVDEWRIVEQRLDLDRLAALESVFAVGNGYLGMRGTPEEGTPSRSPGTLLNGFHESWPIVYPEDAFGLARTGQTIANAPDGTPMRLFVHDEPFDLATAQLAAFQRTLDMRTGVLCRELV